MVNGKKILAVIPARGGSKGIKDKNIREINKKPLIAYTIEAALKSNYIDTVMVSTDSDKIAAVARNYGAWIPFMRPPELAEDGSKTIDVIMDLLIKMNDINEIFDTLILLQPTSPLRNNNDIDGAIEKYFKYNEEPLVAVSKAIDSPILIRKIFDEAHMEKMLDVSSTVRRQDMNAYYRVNGSIYINKISDINYDTSFNDNTLPYIVPNTHAIDIDDEIDLYVAEYLINHLSKDNNL